MTTEVKRLRRVLGRIAIVLFVAVGFMFVVGEIQKADIVREAQKADEVAKKTTPPEKSALPTLKEQGAVAVVRTPAEWAAMPFAERVRLMKPNGSVRYIPYCNGYSYAIWLRLNGAPQETALGQMKKLQVALDRRSPGMLASGTTPDYWATLWTEAAYENNKYYADLETFRHLAGSPRDAAECKNIIVADAGAGR